MSREPDLTSILTGLLGWQVIEAAGELQQVPYWCARVHRKAKVSRDDIRAWWREAVERAVLAERMPALVYKQRGDDWRVVVAWCALNDPRPDDWASYDLAGDCSLAGWAVLVKELAANIERYPAAAGAEVISRTVGH
jgi:hypothetical protein